MTIVNNIKCLQLKFVHQEHAGDRRPWINDYRQIQRKRERERERE